MAPRKRDPSRQTTVEGNPAWQPPPELCQRIHALAGRWTRDRRDLREDLEQEALLAIWLNGETGAPLNHQLQTAQNRMLSVRKLGKSVDGKLDCGYKRPRPYWVVSLEGEGVRMGEHVFPLQEVLPDPVRVEQHVVAKLTLLEVMFYLDPEERCCLLLLCQGFTPKEISVQFRQTRSQVRHRLVRVRRKLRLLLQRWEAGQDAL